MYAISNNYKNELEQKTSLKTKSKIVVDNVEYISEIKTTPKISHKTNSMFGGFPIKTCSFEIYDIDGNLDFKDKEVTVYKGIEINGVVEYIPQGIFIPRAEQIATNISQKTIIFKNIQDKGQIFNDIYKSDLDWTSTHTGLEIIQEICTNIGIELGTTTFNWYDYKFKQPNFSQNTTYREVISRIAEIGGSIAYINRDGKLIITPQFNTNNTISNSRYIKLSREQQFGPINVIVLGKTDINDNIYYPTNKPDNSVEWKILDNPFVDLYREEMIEKVASYIIGSSIIPFEITDFVDGFCYDLNDVLKIVDKKGNMFNAVLLNYETTSRIRSNINVETQETSDTNYNLPGSTKQEYKNIKLDVNHIKNELVSIAEETGELNSKVSKISQNVNEITIEVANVSEQIELVDETISNTNDNLNNNYYKKEQINKLIVDAESGLTNIFTSSGGNNLLRNTAPWYMKSENTGEYWTGNLKQMVEPEAKSGFAILTQQGTLSQTIQIPTKTVNGVVEGLICSISFKYKRLVDGAEGTIKYNGRTITLGASGEIHTSGEVKQVFTLEIIANSNNGFEIYDLMMKYGEEGANGMLLWTQNANESYSETVQIGEGITAISSTTDTKATMNSDGFRVRNKTTGESVMEGTSTGGKLRDLTVTNNSRISGLIIRKSKTTGITSINGEES